MRGDDHLTIGANPIFPVLTEQAIGSGTSKKDNAADILARLDRVRDHKHVSPFKYQNNNDPANAGGTDTATGSLSFADLVDVINPLQHIPVVSTMYRAITGDAISDAAKIAGNTLFMGPIGAASALVDVAVDKITGSDIGEHVVSFFDNEEPSETISDAEVAVLAQEAGAPSFETTNGQVLSAIEPFFFGGATTDSDTLPTTPVAGFAGPAEPVALESLPADILAALYSGEPLQPQTGQYQAAVNNADSSAQTVEEAPRWSLFASPEDNAAPQPSRSPTPDVATQTYGANPLDQMNEPGTVGYQGGWFSTLMPDIVARYEHSATLQRQTHRPIVDIQQ